MGSISTALHNTCLGYVYDELYTLGAMGVFIMYYLLDLAMSRVHHHPINSNFGTLHKSAPMDSPPLQTVRKPIIGGVA